MMNNNNLTTKEDVTRAITESVKGLLSKPTDKYEECRLVLGAVTKGDTALESFVKLVFRIADEMRPIAIEMKG